MLEIITPARGEVQERFQAMKKAIGDHPYVDSIQLGLASIRTGLYLEPVPLVQIILKSGVTRQGRLGLRRDIPQDTTITGVPIEIKYNDRPPAGVWAA